MDPNDFLNDIYIIIIQRFLSSVKHFEMISSSILNISLEKVIIKLKARVYFLKTCRENVEVIKVSHQGQMIAERYMVISCWQT